MFSSSDINIANAVAQCGGIRTAAQKLHKSQPAVSNAVRRLEQKIGFALFDRSAYRIALTPQGRDFLQRCEGLLSIDAQLQDYADVIRKGQESTLSIAVWPMLDQIRLMTVLGRLNEQFPQTSLHIHYIESLGGQTMLLNEEVAVAVYPGRIFAGEQRLENRVIDQMSLINVIAPSLLARKPENRGISEQLLHWNRVVMQDSVSEVSYGVGIHEGGKHWVVNDQRILSQLIYQGLAWGMLPEPVVSDSLKTGELVKLDVPEFGSDLLVDIVVGRLKNHPSGPVASACWHSFMASG